MTDNTSRKRLGRGLAALIGDMDASVATGQADAAPNDGHVPIELVGANPNNPRRNFDTAELDELAQSIREHGVVQPVIVRPSARIEGHYEIIAGERRWRAAQRAGLTQIPVIVRSVDDKAALELAIIENVQRSDLNAVEEALGYQQLMNEHDYTQNDLAQVIAKSRSHVANTLRLLKLPPDVCALVVDGSLSAGHARTLVNAANPMEVAHRIISGNLSVRQAEQLVQKVGEEGKEQRKLPEKREKDADTRALEKALSDTTGLAVTINHRGNGGEMKIAYRDLDQLDDLCRKLNI